jgi:hypothetical protein
LAIEPVPVERIEVAILPAPDAPQNFVPESRTSQVSYTEWLAILTGALAIVSSVQILFLIRADRTSQIAANAALRAAVAPTIL